VSTEHEESALHLAAVRHGEHVIKLLLAHGADAQKLTHGNLSPYAIAARHGNLPAVEVLSRHGAAHELSPLDRLIAACMLGDEEHARTVLADFPDLLAGLG